MNFISKIYGFYYHLIHFAYLDSYISLQLPLNLRDDTSIGGPVLGFYPLAWGAGFITGMNYEVTQADIIHSDIVSHSFCGIKHIPCQDVDDYVSIGRLGLLDAAERYRPDKGASFNTYSEIRIKGHLIDHYRNETYNRHTKQPKPHPLSLEELSEQGIEPSADGLEGRTANKELAHELLASLPERERVIIRLLYWLNLTQNEIAQVFDLTESRISQLRIKTLTQLRQSAEARGLI